MFFLIIYYYCREDNLVRNWPNSEDKKRQVGIMKCLKNKRDYTDAVNETYGKRGLYMQVVRNNEFLRLLDSATSSTQFDFFQLDFENIS